VSIVLEVNFGSKLCEKSGIVPRHIGTVEIEFANDASVLWRVHFNLPLRGLGALVFRVF